MGKVVFSGHGGFDTDTNPPLVTVPDGTTLYFFSDNMKALLDSNGQTVETMATALDSATPSQVVEGGQSCPNYTLYPPDGLDIMDAPDDVEQVIVSSDTTLAELLDQYQGDVYWAACRVVDLDSVGGRFLGVNDAQNALGGSDSTGDDSANMAAWLEWFSGASEQERADAWNAMSYEEQQGAQLVDESVRQWYVSHTDAGSGVLSDEEVDNFLAWWQTAAQSEQDQAWADLTDAQREQISQRSQ